VLIARAFFQSAINHQRSANQFSAMAILRFHVVPNAKTEQAIGAHGDAIKVKLRAPAVEGKANAALLDFLAAQLEISKHAIVLERGQKSRGKLVRIDGLSEIEIQTRLRVAK
jgi:uncharacterized protein